MFPNYAGRADIDPDVAAELEEACIEVLRLPECLRSTQGEVKTIVVGGLHGWRFRRAWYYWRCKGPGIPLETAESLHARFGNEVRVDGHCGCPSPRERFRGLACGNYHVDTQRGLNALAATIQQIVDSASGQT